jgi:hypothetical protein
LSVQRQMHFHHFQVAFLRRALALGLRPISGRLLGAARGAGSQTLRGLVGRISWFTKPISLSHRIHGAAIYGNTYHQYTPFISTIL